MAITSANAQTSQMTGKEWDDPLTTSVNRETAHTLAIPVTSDADVAQNDMTRSPYYQSLNGVWKFKWVGAPTSAKDEW
jgi:beta-galactosidase